MVPDDAGSLHQHVGIDRMADILLQSSNIRTTGQTTDLGHLWCVVAVIEVTVVILQKLLYRFLLGLQQAEVSVNLLIYFLVTRMFPPGPHCSLLPSLTPSRRAKSGEQQCQDCQLPHCCRMSKCKVSQAGSTGKVRLEVLLR